MLITIFHIKFQYNLFHIYDVDSIIYNIVNIMPIITLFLIFTQNYLLLIILNLYLI